MKRERILFILGLLIILSPFYGLPARVMTVVTVVFGLGVVLLSLRRTSMLGDTQERASLNGE